MCMKCGWDWPIKKMATKFVVSLMPEETAQFFLWEMTPIPMGMPTWRQLWQGLRLAGVRVTVVGKSPDGKK